jgi:hypothetical protein
MAMAAMPSALRAVLCNRRLSGSGRRASSADVGEYPKLSNIRKTAEN